MICDRAERRVGGASAPVFGGGFLGFPRKVGYLIGGFLSPSRKNGLMIGDGRRRLRRSAFCRADPAGQPSPPLCGSAAFLGQRGCKVGYLIGGIFILLPQEWLNDRVGRRRLRRSAFCRADPAGRPSPASRLRHLFWGSGAARSVILSGLHFCRKKRENQRGSRASSMRRSSSRG